MSTELTDIGKEIPAPLVEDQEGNVFSIVPSGAIVDIGEAIRPLMASAIEYGIEAHDPDFYIDLCVKEKAHLWAGINGSSLKGIMVSMKVDYPAFSALRLILCAGVPGSLETFREMAWSAVCQWARAVGASTIEVWGRNGWESVLRSYAFPEKKIEVLSYRVPSA